MRDDLPHVLGVDDDRRLRDLWRRYLADNGFRVTAAVDAADARSQLKAFAFDLIVLDRMMPGESGLDFAAALRRESHVPILMLTAMGEVDDRIKGLEAGADDRSEEHTSELQSLMRISYAVFCLKKKKRKT